MLCRYYVKQTHQDCLSLPPQWVYTAKHVLDVFHVWGTASMEDKDNTYDELHSHYLVFNYLANHNNLPKDEHPSSHLHQSHHSTSHAPSHAASWDQSWSPHPTSAGVQFQSASPAPHHNCSSPVASFNNCAELTDVIKRLIYKTWNKHVEG